MGWFNPELLAKTCGFRYCGQWSSFKLFTIIENLKLYSLFIFKYTKTWWNIVDDMGPTGKGHKSQSARFVMILRLYNI